MEIIWVKEAKYVDDYKINISFNDGLNTQIDLEKKINSISAFHPLKDKTLFSNFKLNSLTLEWENQLDISPESLYQLALEQNEKMIIS